MWNPVCLHVCLSSQHRHSHMLNQHERLRCELEEVWGAYRANKVIIGSFLSSSQSSLTVQLNKHVDFILLHEAILITFSLINSVQNNYFPFSQLINSVTEFQNLFQLRLQLMIFRAYWFRVCMFKNGDCDGKQMKSWRCSACWCVSQRKRQQKQRIWEDGALKCLNIWFKAKKSNNEVGG